MPRLLQILLDLVLVVVFAAIGRRSHAEGLDLAGLGQTAAPFVAGALIAWVFLLLRGADLTRLRQGVVVWASTVMLGMLFRVLLREGVQASFVAVTAVALAVLLLGWRLVADLVARRRRPSVQ